MQTTIALQVDGQDFATHVAMPDGTGKFPAVCIIHDALGMSNDVRIQADWLAREGYLVAAPDLFNGRTFLGCLRGIMRDYLRGEGALFDKMEITRQWLINHEQSTGKVGLIGFCFGGGFALMLAPKGGYDVASVNYGTLPKDYDDYLSQSCPIVASYGASDRTLRGVASKLETTLTKAGIDHDVKEYPNTNHAFMNDHSQDPFPFIMRVMLPLMGDGKNDPNSIIDARARVIAFFEKQLKDNS
mgnify:FL=1